LSLDQEWLAFTERTGQTTTIWISPTDGASSARMILLSTENIMDIAFAPDGNLVAAAGPVGNPYLIAIQRSDGAVRPLPDVPRPARYPSFSADGKRFVFSRREAGSWQLVVRDSVTQHEHQLTNEPCNATLPTWQDDNTILYATDCGRGLGLTALARVTLTDR
jgi:Tol biopolymer transport system component